jgi:hypothetical protein
MRYLNASEDANSWVSNTCQKTEVGFLSYHHNPVEIYWVDQNEEENLVGHDLEYGERHTVWQGSYLGHLFRLRDKLDKELLFEFIVEFNCIIPIGTSPSMEREREHIPTLGKL